jgi:hypothetical protein
MIINNIFYNMKTRSQTRKLNETQNLLLEFDYDFDYSSKCWKSNKKSIGNGCYKYICQIVTNMGNPCKRTSLKGETWCKNHSK